jgi:uncharacterized protein with PIN domain
MVSINVRCYAELNDHLHPEQQFIAFPFFLPPKSTVKKLVDDIGINSDLIDLILVNDRSVDLSYILEENDRVALYPAFETFDISTITKVREHPLRQPKFILDVHLGKLANHLRMLGFDTLYKNDCSNEVLLSYSLNENRILLSKNRILIGNEKLTHAYYVKNKDPRLQLIEVLEHLDLYRLADPFTRCIECNSLLKSIEKEIIFSKIPPLVRNWCNEYQWCNSCNRIYWKGSHYQHMIAFIQSILQNGGQNNQSNRIIERKD